MRKLTILTTGLARGGAEAQVVLLARSFHARCWCVEVISMLRPEAHADELSAAGIPVRCLEMRRGVPDPRAIYRIAGMLRQSRPHVLHCHMVHANLLGRVVRPLVRIPVVISTAHSVHEGPRWRERAYRLTDPLCDLTTNVSRAGVERYCRVGVAPADKMMWVANGLDASVYARDAETRRRVRAGLSLGDRFTWLAVGNLREPKDYPTMIEALAALADHPREHTLLVAGAGPLESELRELAIRRGLGGRVRWLGSRPDVPALMNAADALVMSSRWEGTPMVLLEAAASEIPVVATRVGGIPEVVEDECSGYLIPPSEPRALASAMNRLMKLSDAERSAMGRAGRERVIASYSIESVALQWEGIYDRLLQASRESPNGDSRFWNAETSR